MRFNPYVAAGVSLLLFVTMITALALEARTATSRQWPALLMQALFAFMWGGMARRYWIKARVARQMRRP